jgi:hypothetical protein
MQMARGLPSHDVAARHRGGGPSVPTLILGAPMSVLIDTK